MNETQVVSFILLNSLLRVFLCLVTDITNELLTKSLSEAGTNRQYSYADSLT